MKEKYIQLPVLPADLDVSTLQVIWTYAHLSEESRKKSLNELQTLIDEDIKNGVLGEPEQGRALTVDDFAEFMARTIGHLMGEACNLAAWVYQRRFVEGMSRDELEQELGVENEWALVMSDYFDIIIDRGKHSTS